MGETCGRNEAGLGDHHPALRWSDHGHRGGGPGRDEDCCCATGSDAVTTLRRAGLGGLGVVVLMLGC